MSKFVIEEQSVDTLKENYNKVIFQKQMLVAQSDKKRMEQTKTIDRWDITIRSTLDHSFNVENR